MWLYTELKRRNVFRVGAAYLVVGWLLIQVAETIFPLFGFNEGPARVVVVVLAISFPLALIFSWLYELTPEGLKLERDVDRSSSIVHHTGKKLDRAIIVVLVLALGYFAFDKFVLSESREASIAKSARQEGRSEALVESFGDSSIAVLPFVNMSDDPGNEYFSDGISEELLNLLSKIPRLRVISRSSSFSFRGKDIHIPTVAEQLNVAYIVEGSVRKYGNQVRITAQLIEARSDTHLWSDTYDRELVDVFAIQDEISAAIVEELRNSMGLQIEAAPRVIAAANIEAYDAYLRGRHLVVQRSDTSIESAVREYEKALELDPDFALAHAELAIAFLLQVRGGKGTLTETEAVDRAGSHAELAMNLAPTLAEAHAATGWVLWKQGNKEEGLTYLRQAIQINQNYSFIYNLLGNAYTQLGRYKESFAMYETAVRVDPALRPSNWNYILGLIRRNRQDEADRQLEKYASFNPLDYATLRSLTTSLGGKWTDFLIARMDYLLLDPGALTWRRGLSGRFAAIGLEKEALAISDSPGPWVLSLLGKPEDAITNAEARLDEDPKSVWARSGLGMALAAAGKYDRARPILEEMWQQNGERVTCCGVFDVDSAAALIAIRRTTGEEAGVDEIVTALMDEVRRYHEAGIIRVDPYYGWPSVDYVKGLAAFLTGEREEGLALIAKAVEDGHLILPNEAYLQTLYDDPGFAPIRASQEARQARERERFLAIVCTDNPYESVWQPEEGTCERFVASGAN